MRAAMTYVFGRLYGAGHTSWAVSGSTASGNPSVSSQVATYMLSLRRRKVQEGEAPTSTRAITSVSLALSLRPSTLTDVKSILESLYDYNHLPENYDITLYDDCQRRGLLAKDDLHCWGSPRLRRALHAIYTLAFLCLLRVDEVLNIQLEHIEFIENGSRSILVLTLPFRKTHQFGGM